MSRPSLAFRASLALTALSALVWLGIVAAWISRALPPTVDLIVIGEPDFELYTGQMYALVFTSMALLSVLWLYWSRGRVGLTPLVTASLAFLPLWQWSVFAADLLDWPGVRTTLANWGVAISFFIGLVWVVYFVEQSWQRHQRRLQADPDDRPRGTIWNPLHPLAWYYSRANGKLSQSLTILATYSVLFLALFLLAGQLGGCREIYEMPAGGGKEQAVAQTVKIQKIIKKKFIINPFSSVIFRPPPIDDVKLQLTEVTAHQYKIGQGDGDGAGFGAGTSRGKVRFIRLEYSGGDWDQDFGVGADLNLLLQYGVRTGHPVAEQTESRTIPQLANFPIGKSPPLLYLTGQRNITLSKNEIKILREYLIDKYGMLFGDNGGSPHFHNQFFAMMRQVLPEVEPVRIPLDDVIHRIPYTLPFLPFVAPHGGREAYGWKMNGRWVCYYHPGDIGDAWADGHAGVRTEVWEACYQLGTNVIFYAHAEYNKWLTAKQQGKK